MVSTVRATDPLSPPTRQAKPLRFTPARCLPVIALALLLPLLASAQTKSPTTEDGRATEEASPASPELAPAGGPIAEALAAVDEDVRRYHEHVTTLANPFLEGRSPGTRGSILAGEYVQTYFERFGLESLPLPGAENAGEGDVAAYFHPFPMRGRTAVVDQALAVGETLTLEPDVDFCATGLGGSGRVTAPLTFVGYSIPEGPEGYVTYEEGDDLTGRIALMMRFEPMDENGVSLWSERGWSNEAALYGKLQAAIDHHAEAVILVNPPGAADRRSGRLFRGGGGSGEIPVLSILPEAAQKLLDATGAKVDLLELRRRADLRGGIEALGGEPVTVMAALARRSIQARNVGAYLPGRGALADEVIVVGAHYDHLGYGEFGSREGPGEIHSGADDNASGTAALLLCAEKLAASYEALPDGQDARSIAFLAFDAEESGLNGSRYYVSSPPLPLENHYLMVNFDMLGRIRDNRLRVHGTTSAKGFGEWLAPFFERSSLTVSTPEEVGYRSDHANFYRAEIPVLFAMIEDFHDDYHTSKDVSWKINRVAATEAVRLFHEVVMAAAQRPEPLEYVPAARPERRGGPSMAAIRVRFGIRPSNYEDAKPGILVGGVSPGSSAEVAGVREGDRLTGWGGDKVEGIRDWMGLLSRHAPGDEVRIEVERDGEIVELDVVLQGKGNDRE